MNYHERSFQARKKAWDDMQPPSYYEDGEEESDEEVEDPRIADYEWFKMEGES